MLPSLIRGRVDGAFTRFSRSVYVGLVFSGVRVIA